MRIRRKPLAMPEREAELCERFAAAARDQGWDVFPEVAGWDVVLVWNRPAIYQGPAPGDQLALEAKMRAGVDALAQAHQRSRWSGPDFRGVLVPDATRDFRHVARELRLHVFDLRHCGPWKPAERKHRSWDRWERSRTKLEVQGDLRWNRDRRLWLPPVPLQGAGGAPSPRQLTRWRVGALRLCALLRSRGWITSEDFKREKINPSRWPAVGWLVGEGKIGKLTRYVPGPAPLPDVGYEAERDALAAVG